MDISAFQEINILELPLMSEVSHPMRNGEFFFHNNDHITFVKVSNGVAHLYDSLGATHGDFQHLLGRLGYKVISQSWINDQLPLDSKTCPV